MVRVPRSGSTHEDWGSVSEVQLLKTWGTWSNVRPRLCGGFQSELAL